MRGTLGEQTADHVCIECARTTGGNPLHARQLVAALKERGGGRASLDAGAIAAIGPLSVARFVTDRLSRRPPAVAVVARALAILGDDASLADIAKVAGVDRDATADAVDALIAAGLLHPGLPPRFVHPIIQQSLQDSTAPAERARLHLSSARDPDRCERVAAHLLAEGGAGPVGERWALDALTAAAQRAGDRGSPDQAVRFLRRALDEEAPASRRRSVLLDLGAAESAARLPEAAGRMDHALRLSSGPAERAHATLGLSMVRFLAQPPRRRRRRSRAPRRRARITPNQAAAQEAADTRAPDGDGIYCEDLACPCSTEASGGDGRDGDRGQEPDAGGSCTKPEGVQWLVFRASRYPNIRRHFRSALRRGWPRRQVLNRPGADARRERLLMRRTVGGSCARRRRRIARLTSGARRSIRSCW